MPKKDPRIDTYIQKSATFAKPILKYLRTIVHQNCPKTEETMKWSFPHFTYNGKLLCAMAAFKAHCTLGFWKGAHIVNNDGSRALAAMGQMGRLTTIQDLPSKRILANYIKQAMKFNEEDAPVIKRAIKHKKPPLKAPADFMRAIKANKKALETFENFSPSHKREYVSWILEAKTEETRERRLETAVEWMSQGKPRMWKYMK